MSNYPDDPRTGAKTAAKSHHFAALIAGAFFALASAYPAFGDDTELFVGDSAQFPQAKPNILFVIDTSGSMGSQVDTQPPFDPAVAYAGSCGVDRVYWRTGTGDPPDCSTDRWFDESAFMCQRALTAFSTSGRYVDGMAQFDDTVDNRWETLDTFEKGRLVECQDDGSENGNGVDASKLFAQSGVPGEPWGSDPANEVAWGQTPVQEVYTVYDSNYLNWYYSPPVPSTRIDVVKEVATGLLDTTAGVNVGLMRFNSDEGGPVIHAMEDIESARAPMRAKINALPASGSTPISETLFEAAQYYRGGLVDYGNNAAPELSAVESRSLGDANVYQSPLEFGCQKNFVVLLTDGAPTQDSSADAKITALPDFGTLVGGACDGSGDGHCMDDLAAWLYQQDLRPDLPGLQNVITYTIGFTVNLPILSSTATRGGGSYFTADDTATLSTALTNIVTSILDTQTTFTSPTVSVNAFNRTQNLNDLFVTVFQPDGREHWAGNLKKYVLANDTITDANGIAAVDPANGFFLDTAQSFWSANPDGANVTSGGAAEQLPDPAVRNLYTYLGNADLTLPSNDVGVANPALTSLLLGLGQPGDPARNDVIDFARGLDVTDVDQNNVTNEPRNRMGDPLHGKPVSVVYGGSAANPEGVVYVGTNDGYLHAIDTETGVEKWAFIPPDFLPELANIYANESSAQRSYGIDGTLSLQVKANNDGTIDPAIGERVYLYFGMRRGGTFYYGLDITDPDSPSLLWRLDGTDLPDLGQSWSAPVPTRAAVSGAPQNPDNLVVLFSGGYDASQDNLATSTDGVGNAVYMIDSVSGQRLWHASDAGANLNIPEMQYSLPGNLKVIDLNGNGYADRFYAADMGGQVLRFDVFNGSPANSFATGGVFAQLGASAQAAPSPVEDVRRFYYPADLALAQDDDQSFLHIGIGSGHRARPNSAVTEDRFYALRDYDVFNQKTQPQASAFTPIQEADLLDITDDINAAVPIGSAGWRLELRIDGWRGEKVLAEARTFADKIYFTTFTPSGGASVNNCEPALGVSRLYVLDLYTGAPVNNLDGIGDDQNLTEEDRFTEFQGTISSEVVFVFPSPDDPVNCVGDECTPPPVACVDLFCFPPGFGNAPIRTFWSQESTR